MTESARSVPLELRLHYTHGLGALSPYFAGLERGVACATRCTICRRTWFPPRSTCTCGARTLEWFELSGRGTIVDVTQTRMKLPGSSAASDFAFALLRLDGADNLCFGRLARAAAHLGSGALVQLSRAQGPWPHPSQCAEFVQAPLASLSDQS